LIGTHRHVYKKAAPGEFFKFCKCGKRKKAGKTERQVKKGLMRKAEDLWREIVHKRDGEGCQVRKVFPELNLNHSDQMQVDHFFPRADKNLFFEPSNATVLCSICNYLKSNGSPQSTIINIAVKEIVLRREGQTKFDEMFQLNNSRPPNLEWGRKHYLESVIQRLQEQLEWAELNQ
jgi:hypothetical protein